MEVFGLFLIFQMSLSLFIFLYSSTTTTVYLLFFFRITRRWRDGLLLALMPLIKRACIITEFRLSWPLWNKIKIAWSTPIHSDFFLFRILPFLLQRPRHFSLFTFFPDFSPLRCINIYNSFFIFTPISPLLFATYQEKKTRLSGGDGCVNFSLCSSDTILVRNET